MHVRWDQIMSNKIIIKIHSISSSKFNKWKNFKKTALTQREKLRENGKMDSMKTREASQFGFVSMV